MLPLLPDPEDLCIAVLKSLGPVAALCGDRIATNIPDIPTFPLIRVTLVSDPYLDDEGAQDVEVQVECWANSDATASLLARTVQACRLDMQKATSNGWVALATTSGGPMPAPDPDSERSRYILTLSLTVGY